jgi:hypothetical protein
MTQFKGTEGKWKMFKEFSKCYSVESDSYIICNTVTKLYPTDKANALLISKAPELLEMLEDIVNYGGVANFDKIKQLIKEATEL